MNYDEAITYLYRSRPAFHLIGAKAYKPGQQNTLALMEHLGHPECAWPSVHIAGTNGKGSTSHMIAASLQAAGYKVGLYTSPHLVDYRERIRVNGQMIPREWVAEWVTRQQTFLDRLQPSFFETTMALAFCYFAEQQVDIAVVEVGLGGRLDSTNIITPMVSVITNIGMDHTEFLGTTLADIAAEKAGIIKPGVPCVIGETDPETQPVFERFAREAGIWGDGPETTDCRIWFADRCGYLRRKREREAGECQLKGSYQEHNRQTAYVALQLLLPMLSERYGKHVSAREAIARGFAEVCTLTGLRGRWEQIGERPLTICDTGHNSHGIRYVAEQLRGMGTPLHIVLGMVDDKDVDVVMQLLPQEARYYWCQAQTHRAIPATRMAELGAQTGLHGKAYETVAEALGAARAAAQHDEVVFVGGSNYVVGEVLTTIGQLC